MVSSVVTLDTMVVSALLHPARAHPAAADYRARVAGRPIVVSFVVVTELRYGALKAGWGQKLIAARAVKRNRQPPRR
jgi:predicted nucleic acid-binding protein